LAGDERFATNAQRVSNRPILVPIVADILASRGREDWVAQLGQAGVPCGVVREIGDLLQSPQIDARDMVTAVPHATAGALRLVASPVKLSGSSTRPDRPPPLLGQHTDAILTEDLGLSAEALSDLRRQKIV
jgi:formyl-CoA transferase